MKKKFVSWLLATLVTMVGFTQNLTSTAPNGTFTASDILYWVGTGQNEVGVTILYNFDSGADAFTFGYRWSGGNISFKDIFDALKEDDARFNYLLSGGFLDDITIDIDGDGVVDYSMENSNTQFFMIYSDNVTTNFGFTSPGITNGNHWLGFVGEFGTGGAGLTLATATYTPISSMNIASCPSPYNVSISNITQNSATISWQDTTINSSNHCWLYYKLLSAENFDSIEIQNSTSHTLTGLSASSQYLIYLRTICEDTISNKTKLQSFYTSCGDITNLPYSEDFDSYGVHTYNGPFPYPNCWTKISSTKYPFITNSNYSSPGSLYMVAGQHDTVIAIAPKLGDDIDMSSIKLSFFIKPASMSARLTVGVMTDPNDASTFDSIQFIIPTTKAWEKVEFNFAEYSGAAKYIAFKSQGADTGNVICVDNVLIQSIPDCEHPNKLKVVKNTVDETSADISFTKGLYSDNSWYLYYKVITDDVYDSILIYDNPYTLEGLSLQTTYDIYMRTNCGDNNLSISSDTIQYKTPCESTVITTFPYSESFENGIECLEQINVNGNSEWTTSSEMYKNTSNIPDGNKYLLYKFKGKGPKQVCLLPVMDLSTLNAPKLALSHIQAKWTNDQDSLKIVYRTSATDTLHELVTYNTSITSWQQDTIELVDANATYQIGFYGYIGYGHGIGIDNISVFDGEAIIPGCNNDTLYQVETICEGNSYNFFGEILTTAGTYKHNVAKSDGCDSVYHLILSISPKYNIVKDTTVIGTNFTYDGYTFTANGSHIYEYQTVNGCDSTLTLNVTFITPQVDMTKYIVLNVQSGQNISLDFTAFTNNTGVKIVSGNNEKIINIGTAWSDYVNYLAGASTMTIYGNIKALDCQANGNKLTGLDVTNNPDLIYLYCFGNNFTTESYDALMCSLPERQINDNAWFFPLYNASDTNSSKFMASNSSNATTKYWTVKYYSNYSEIGQTNGSYICGNNPMPTYDSVMTKSICEGESYVFFDTTLTTAGVYQHTIVASVDTNITLTLIVNPTYNIVKDTTVKGASYTYENYTFTVSGSHIYEYQTINGCDSTLTLNVTFTSALNDAVSESFAIYPNPAQNEITINGLRNEIVKVYSLDGKLLISEIINEKLDISMLDSGTYIIYVRGKQKKIVKQ